MSSFSFSSLENIISTTLDALTSYWNNLSLYLIHFIIFVNDTQSKIVAFIIENLPYSIQFSNFQWKLLKGFSLILITNLILICVAWRIFGKNICERFMKPGIDQLLIA